MSLLDTQKQFSDALISTDWQDRKHPAEKLIKSTDLLSSRQRLAIYRNTGLTARINVLKQIYPVCESIMGARSFNNLAHDYALESIPRSPDLNLYGGNFAEFVDKMQQIVILGEYQYLKDLCWLEWLWHAVYYRENDQPFDFDAFEKYSDQPEKVHLTLSHALEIMSSDHPVHLIWKQHRTEQTDLSVAGLQEPEYLCIYRDEFIPKVDKISWPVFELLEACRRGDSLQKLSSNSKLSSAMQELPALIERGWISGFNYHV